MSLLRLRSVAARTWVRPRAPRTWARPSAALMAGLSPRLGAGVGLTARGLVLTRGLSTQGDDSKSVKAAAEQLFKAAGHAMPSTGQIAAILGAIGTAPLYANGVSGVYAAIARILGTPTNQAVQQLHLAIAQLAGVATPHHHAAALPLPPTASPTSATSSASGSMTAAAAYLAQVHECVSRQPRDKTCGQLADELQAWSHSIFAAAASTAATTAATQSTASAPVATKPSPTPTP